MPKRMVTAGVDRDSLVGRFAEQVQELSINDSYACDCEYGLIATVCFAAIQAFDAMQMMLQAACMSDWHEGRSSASDSQVCYQYDWVGNDHV